MDGQDKKKRFDDSVTLEDIRLRVERFAQERDWDQVIFLLYFSYY